jgi:hypothetical protein
LNPVHPEIAGISNKLLVNTGKMADMVKNRPPVALELASDPFRAMIRGNVQYR